jgi:hypothetical protein
VNSKEGKIQGKDLVSVEETPCPLVISPNASTSAVTTVSPEELIPVHELGINEILHVNK